MPGQRAGGDDRPDGEPQAAEEQRQQQMKDVVPALTLRENGSLAVRAVALGEFDCHGATRSQAAQYVNGMQKPRDNKKRNCHKVDQS
jgi:hypothetical protein